MPERTPILGIDFGTGQDMNLHCGATRPSCRERCVQCSLPCVGNSDRRTTHRPLAKSEVRSLLEIFPAKEDKKRLDSGVEIT